MVSGLSGKPGNSVLEHVVVVIKSPGDPVLTRRLLLEEQTVKGIAFALDHATKGDALVNTYPYILLIIIIMMDRVFLSL